ncbi:MAG: S-adenosylmethionine decarboxylase [bacterium]|nr:S-adenosylmethionine decarboxylase [bacterium]
MEQQLGLRDIFSSSVLDAIAQDDQGLRREYQEQQAWGLLASLDLHNCNREVITNPEKIRQFVVELCERIGMVRHGECHIDQFGEGELLGYSMFQFIETSSITAHFDDKISNAGYIDIFSCKYFNPFKAAEFAKKFFGASDYNLTYTLRK